MVPVYVADSKHPIVIAVTVEQGGSAAENGRSLSRA